MVDIWYARARAHDDPGLVSWVLILAGWVRCGAVRSDHHHTVTVEQLNMCGDRGAVAAQLTAADYH